MRIPVTPTDGPRSLSTCIALAILAVSTATAAPGWTDDISARGINAAATSNSTNVTAVPLGTRAVFGLQDDWMQHNSIYIGFLPDWSHENPQDVNKALGAPMAIIGDYVDISTDDTSLSQIGYHTSAITNLKKDSIYCPAIRPRFTLDQWTDDMSTAVANTMASLNKQGVTVWLRFAWEMNGNWLEYGQQPSQFVSAWQSLTSKIRATTNQTYMLWSPNVRYGDVSDIAGYTQYYPGVDYVDLAGLSLYSPAAEGQVASSGAFVNAFDSFYKLYGKTHPLVISETGAAYTYAIPSSLQASYCADCSISGTLPNTTTLTPVPAGASSQASMKVGWLNQVLSDQAAGRYPNLTAVSFFNYFKFGGAGSSSSAESNDTGTLVDFRVTGGDEATEQQFRAIVGNTTAYQGGYTGGARESAISKDNLLVILLVLAASSIILSL